MSPNLLHSRPRAKRLPVLVAVVIMMAACAKPPSIDKLMSDARQFQKQGDTRSAIIQLRNVLQRDNRRAEARYMLGSIYLKKGDVLRAETQFREALREKYQPKRVLPLLAKALFAQGKFQAVLDETRSSDYGDIALQPEILSLRGHSQLSLGKDEEAARSFDEALQRDPHFAQALLGQARLAINKRNYSNALKLTDKAVAADPTSLDAWLMKGDLERAMQHTDESKAAYEQAYKLNPHDLATNMNMASVAMADGNLDEARKYVNTMHDASPDNPIANYFLGLIEFRQKHYKSADEAVKKVLKSSPNYTPAQALAGAVAFHLGAYEQAAQQLQGVVLLYPKSIHFRKMLATALLKAGKPQESLDVLKPLDNPASGDVGLLALIAEANYQSGQVSKAKRYFEAATKLAPKNSKLRAGLGLSRLAMGEKERAIADLESAVKEGESNGGSNLISALLAARQYKMALDIVTRLEKKGRQNDPNLLNIKGTILLARKDTADARIAFERALKVQPGYFPAMMNLATLDVAEKNFQSARTRYKELLNKDSSNMEVMLALARLETANGKQEEALTWLEHAKSMQPKAFAPNFAMARIFIEQHKYSKAIAVLRDALSARPSHPEALNMLGYSQLQAGQSGNAIDTYNKLTSLYPRSAQAQYALGIAQAAGGNQSAAIITLQQVLELQPDFPGALTTLVKLEIDAGQTSEALKIAGQARRLYPKRALGSLLEGNIYMAAKKYAAATRAYHQAFQLERDDEALKRLHNAMRMNKQGAAADGLLVKWLKEHPGDTQIRLYYADAAIKKNNYELAIKQYRHVLDKQPHDLGVLHNLGWCYQQLHDLPKALQVAEQAYEANGDVPLAAVDLAELLLERGQGGDGDRAVNLLEKARDLAPADPETRYTLAKAYTQTGDKNSARRELKQLLLSKDDFPGREDAAKLFKRLSR